MNIIKFFKGNIKKYHPLDDKIVKEFNKIRTADQRKYLCHAPFKSLTFFHTGDVLACWYNKLFPLGKYPDDTIHDIWFSGRSETLRKYILHKDLSYGCADCRKTLNNKDFYSTGAWRYDFLPEKNTKYPVSMDFQISNSCNLQCIMCNGEYSTNHRANRENKDPYKNPYDDDFFKQLEPFIPHLKEASFSGGEPFFAKEFFKIWDLIIKLNPKIKISVTTNGNILNDKVWSYLNALPFNISVSFDAITEDTYGKVRVNGNYNTVMKHMPLFADYAEKAGTVFAVKICPIRQNWHEIPQLATFLNEKNYSFLFNSVMFPPYCSLWNLDSAKLEEIMIFLKKYSLTGDSDIQKQNATRYEDFIRQIEVWHNEALTRDKINFYQLSVSELSEIFFKNVEDYLANELKYLDDESPVILEDIKKIFERMIKESPDEKTALEGMRYYAAGPVARHLAELNVRDYEKNSDRFFQTGTYCD